MYAVLCAVLSACPSVLGEGKMQTVMSVCDGTVKHVGWLLAGRFSREWFMRRLKLGQVAGVGYNNAMIIKFSDI